MRPSSSLFSIRIVVPAFFEGSLLRHVKLNYALFSLTAIVHEEAAEDCLLL